MARSTLGSTPRSSQRSSLQHCQALRLHLRLLLLLSLCLVTLVLFLCPLASSQGTLTQVSVLWSTSNTGSNVFIGQGETVSWIWFDTGSYSIEGTDDASKAVFTGTGTGPNCFSQKNFTYTKTFDQPGVFNYDCPCHPFTMTGTVTVKSKYNFGGTTIQWFLGVSFGAASAIIYEGDTITWSWADDLPHGLTAMDGDLSVFADPGGPGTNANLASLGDADSFTVSKTFKTAGIYLYKCQNHGGQMQGNITVLSKPGPTPSPGKRAGHWVKVWKKVWKLKKKMVPRPKPTKKTL